MLPTAHCKASAPPPTGLRRHPLTLGVCRDDGVCRLVVAHGGDGRGVQAGQLVHGVVGAAGGSEGGGKAGTVRPGSTSRQPRQLYARRYRSPSRQRPLPRCSHLAPPAPGHTPAPAGRTCACRRPQWRRCRCPTPPAWRACLTGRARSTTRRRPPPRAGAAWQSYQRKPRQTPAMMARARVEGRVCGRRGMPGGGRSRRSPHPSTPTALFVSTLIRVGPTVPYRRTLTVLSVLMLAHSVPSALTARPVTGPTCACSSAGGEREGCCRWAAKHGAASGPQVQQNPALGISTASSISRSRSSSSATTSSRSSSALKRPQAPTL